MLYLPIWCQNMWRGDIRKNTPQINILTAWEELCQLYWFCTLVDHICICYICLYTDTDTLNQGVCCICYIQIQMLSTRVYNGIYRGDRQKFGERYKEHLRTPSPIFNHSHTTWHNITLNNFSIRSEDHKPLLKPLKKQCTSGSITHY